MVGITDFDPAWAEVFDEWDRLLVESAFRLAAGVGGPIDVERQLFLGLLFVAKAIRHNHAAVSLDATAFNRVCQELFELRDSRGSSDTPSWHVDVDELRLALGSAPPCLIEVVDLAAPGIEIFGSPFVLSCQEGVPAFVSTRRLAVAECEIATRLLEAASSTTSTTGSPLPLPATADVLAAADPSFVNDGVRSFIERAMTRSVSVLTGGPGTGKTTAVATLLKALGELGRRQGRHFSIALCAPTAKAAVRMRDALNVAFGERGLGEYEAELLINPRSGSVHRLLEIRPDDATNMVDLACDLVIVDEVSMLELPMLDHVLRAAGQSHVVLAGDPDQLVSVEVGAVLRDIVSAGSSIEGVVTRLVASHRSNQAILEMAASINSGDYEEFSRAVSSHPHELAVTGSASDALHSAVTRAEELRHLAALDDETAALRLLGGQAVLCANREGERSVTWWNTKIANALDRRAPLEVADGARFKVGTPIMVLRNETAPSSERAGQLSNGDVGVVCSTNGDVEVVFLPATASPRRRKIRSIDQASAAWALTIHKSQGSEYQRVIVSLPERPNRILSRELLYTAVTRAKESVVVIGSKDVIAAALARGVERVSGLAERVRARSSPNV